MVRRSALLPQDQAMSAGLCRRVSAGLKIHWFCLQHSCGDRPQSSREGALSGETGGWEGRQRLEGARRRGGRCGRAALGHGTGCRRGAGAVELTIPDECVVRSLPMGGHAPTLPVLGDAEDLASWRRGPVQLGRAQSEVFEDSVDGVLIAHEGEGAHALAATDADERIDLVDLGDQPGPAWGAGRSRTAAPARRSTPAARGAACRSRRAPRAS
jgi:hypothetical protein